MEVKADHYRKLAERSRQLAKRITDAEAKAHMLEVAQQYEKLAAEIEVRAGGRRSTDDA